MDIAHFEIIVNAMLSWSTEPRASRKAVARPVVAERPRGVFDDDDDFDSDVDDVDNDSAGEDDDFEPDEKLSIKADSDEAGDADLAELDQAE